MNYTYDDVCSWAKRMEAYYKICRDKRFIFSYGFDPRRVTHDHWRVVYFPMIKQFLEDLTYDNWKQILDDHRKKWNEREEKNKRFQIKRHPFFKHTPDRDLPLDDKVYNKIRNKLAKRYFISKDRAVFFINDKGRAVICNDLVE